MVDQLENSDVSQLDDNLDLEWSRILSTHINKTCCSIRNPEMKTRIWVYKRVEAVVRVMGDLTENSPPNRFISNDKSRSCIRGG